MVQPIYLPREPDPLQGMSNMLMQMFMMRFAHKMDMEREGLKLKERAAQQKETGRTGLLTEGWDEVSPDEALHYEKTGTMPSDVEQVYGSYFRRPTPKAEKPTTIKTDQGIFETFVKNGRLHLGKRLGSAPEKQGNLQRKARTFVKGGQKYSQDYDFDPTTGKETLVGDPYQSDIKKDTAGTTLSQKESRIQHLIEGFRSPRDMYGRIQAQAPEQKSHRLRGLLRALAVERKAGVLDDYDISRAMQTTMTDLGIDLKLQEGLRAAMAVNADVNQLMEIMQAFEQGGANYGR